MATATPELVTTAGGADGWRWIGADERGRELEVLGIGIEPEHAEPYLLVIHVMPTQFRG
jgi:hypothetical protein